MNLFLFEHKWSDIKEAYSKGSNYLRYSEAELRFVPMSALAFSKKIRSFSRKYKQRNSFRTHSLCQRQCHHRHNVIVLCKFDVDAKCERTFTPTGRLINNARLSFKFDAAGFFFDRCSTILTLTYKYILYLQLSKTRSKIQINSCASTP